MSVTCAVMVAPPASRCRAAKISAALLYHHGMQMGKRCVTVDYVKAITMLNEAGESSTAATLVNELSTRANSGNPKAANALKKLQKLGLVKEVRVE